MSNSVKPCRWQHTRLPHPWDSSGKNSGVGCHFLLQCMKVKSESDPDSSVGKEFACNAGDSGSIPGLGRSTEVGIGYPLQYSWASLVVQLGKESACNVGDLGSIPGLGRSLGEGNGYPLQYFGLENSMHRGAWWATVHAVAKSRTRLSDFTSQQRWHQGGTQGSFGG